MDYPSVICNYCRYTDYGILPVGTAYYNLCEGVCCEEALDTYNDAQKDEDKIASLEDAF